MAFTRQERSWELGISALAIAPGVPTRSSEWLERGIPMGDEAKPRAELLSELEELRKRVTALEAEQLDRAGFTDPLPNSKGTGIPQHGAFFEQEDPLRPLHVGYEATESIELKSLFTRDVTTSGSFDVRSGIWATTFGKVIQALPIPTFLVDEAFKVTVANQACGRFTPEYEKIQGKPFSILIGGASAAVKALLLLEQVFTDRKPRIAEGTLRIDVAMMWARMTFRPIRIMNDRYALVLAEDLTREKVQLHENEMLRRELEQRVQRRTAALRKTNEDLVREVVERKRAEHERERVIVELQQALAQVKRLSGLLPICAACKKIRDDKGYWQQIEAYIRDRSEAQFSHGICPECARRLYPDLFKD